MWSFYRDYLDASVYKHICMYIHIYIYLSVPCAYYRFHDPRELYSCVIHVYSLLTTTLVKRHYSQSRKDLPL